MAIRFINIALGVATSATLALSSWHFLWNKRSLGLPEAGPSQQELPEEPQKRPRPRMTAFVEFIKPSKPIFQFQRCALVGSSKDLLGKGLGPDISAHDTVIRVNRVPPRALARDFGERTDVLFIGAKQNHRHTLTQYGQLFRSFGGKLRMCDFKGSCPFRMVILKHANGRYMPPKGSRLAVARQVPKVHNFAVRLLREYLQENRFPTSGFEAFVTFGLLCNSLDVYGFSGTKTADGHKFHGVHSVGQVVKEHKLIDLIVAGNYPSTDHDRKKLKRLQDKGKRRRRIVK